MCLYKNRMCHRHNRPLIADEDIVCYKLVNKSTDGTYTTPHTDTIVPIECIEHKVPFKAKIVNPFRFFCYHILGTTGIVGDGFIHVYKDPQQSHCGCITFKCIIPKGTKYFVGALNDYAAKKIVFLEEIK